MGRGRGHACFPHSGYCERGCLHPHVHCVVPAGGLSPDHTRWVRSPDNYFLPKKVLRKIFRGKFVDALKQAFQNGQLNFHGDLKLLAQPKIFAAWLRLLFQQHWVVYLKRPFGGPEYVLHIWAATPIAWLSPITVCSPLPMAKSPFAGAIPPTTTNRNSWPYPSTSSCAASYCISCRKASCASATSAFWPTGGVPLSYRFAFTFSARHNNRKPNKTSPPPKTLPILGTAPSAVAR